MAFCIVVMTVLTPLVRPFSWQDWTIAHEEFMYQKVRIKPEAFDFIWTSMGWMEENNMPFSRGIFIPCMETRCKCRIKPIVHTFLLFSADCRNELYLFYWLAPLWFIWLTSWLESTFEYDWETVKISLSVCQTSSLPHLHGFGMTKGKLF